MLDGQQNARLQGGQVRKSARRLYLYARTFRQKTSVHGTGVRTGARME